jgi:hypothetical protein
MSAEDFGVKAYMEQGFAAIRVEIEHVAEALKQHRGDSLAYQKAMNLRMDTLATKAELREAIETSGKRIGNLKKIVWSACMIGGTMLGATAKVLWDFIRDFGTHKIGNP